MYLVFVCLCVCVRAYVSVCMCACVRMCVCLTKPDIITPNSDMAHNRFIVTIQLLGCFKQFFCVSACNCDPDGSRSDICDPVNGKCLCRQNVVGRACDQCIEGYYNLSAGHSDRHLGCVPCLCHALGSTSSSCDVVSGKDNVEHTHTFKFFGLFFAYS